MYACRAGDLESKGKIESVVKFIKRNFLENRVYADDDILNTCVLEWLDCTGNAKIHGTTKQIPAEMFKIERECLRPLQEAALIGTEYICRTVRKDNTILYDSNRYSVPIGTYDNQKEVQIDAKDGVLRILTIFGEPICEHMISTGRGMLIKNQNHSRNKSERLDKLLNTVNTLLNYEVTNFLNHLRYDKTRYARDQLKVVESLCNKYGAEDTIKAIQACEEMGLMSAVHVKDYLKHYHTIPITPVPVTIPLSGRKYHITTEKRPIEAYVKAGGSR